jgi:hypothetical protein
MRNRSQLALGLILILLGVWFVAQRQVPALGTWVQTYLTWPLNLVAIGAVIFLVGLLVGSPGMSVPAAVVAGIGGILVYQSRSNDYTSWSFAWALIPGFVGMGQAVAGLLQRNWREARSGLNLIVTSAILFLVFAALFGRLSLFGNYVPAIGLILLGVWFLARGLWRRADRS